MRLKTPSFLACFKILVGSSQKWIDEEGNIYHIKVSLFQEHDHDHAPIYYLDYPLDPSIQKAHANQVVVSVECSSDSLTSPYSAVIESKWVVCRKNVDLIFTHLSESEIIIECMILHATSPRKIMGVKGNLSEKQIQQAIEECNDQ